MLSHLARSAVCYAAGATARLPGMARLTDVAKEVKLPPERKPQRKSARIFIAEPALTSRDYVATGARVPMPPGPDGAAVQAEMNEEMRTRNGRIGFLLRERAQVFRDLVVECGHNRGPGTSQEIKKLLSAAVLADVPIMKRDAWIRVAAWALDRAVEAAMETPAVPPAPPEPEEAATHAA